MESTSAPAKIRDGENREMDNVCVKCGSCGNTVEPTSPKGLWVIRCPRCGAAVGGGGEKA